MLRLPICAATQVVLVAPHYPENVGAVARAMKTMGITQLCLVRPGRLAAPENEMAFKMAVRAWDVLESARVVDSLSEALRGYDLVFATTARRGQNGLLTPRRAAQLAQQGVERGQSNCIVIGNEKTGLSTLELSRCTHRVRIAMAADQPSINLAQSVQILAYEWFTLGLHLRTEAALQRGDASGSEVELYDADAEASQDTDSEAEDAQQLDSTSTARASGKPA